MGDSKDLIADALAKPEGVPPAGLTLPPPKQTQRVTRKRSGNKTGRAYRIAPWSARGRRQQVPRKCRCGRAISATKSQCRACSRDGS